MSTSTGEIIDRTLSGERLSSADAVALLEEGDLLDLGAAANEVRNRLNDPAVATYIVDRNINYTNVCVYRGGRPHLRGASARLRLARSS